MSVVPETLFARTEDGLSIAYQTLGDGPRDIVLAPTAHCIDLMWEEPAFAHVLRRLARLGRLICLDYRGFGGSDPVPLGALPTPEAWMEDTRVVLDAVGSKTAHIVCHGGSGFIGMLFAATYPERTATLTLLDATARYKRDDDYPIGLPADMVDSFVQWSQQAWGTPAHTAWAPSRGDDDAFWRWQARFQRGSSSPATHGALLHWAVDLDLRAVLPTIRVPTLVVHRAEGSLSPLDHGHYLADRIPDAALIVVPGSDHWFFTQHADEIVDHIEESITGVMPVRELDRSLATVMFTDIVSSTEHAARLGDRGWTQILDQHDELVQRELDRHGGRKVNPTGDGLLATFDGPARAVRCAQAICSGVGALGIQVRAGLHTGEVELRGDDIGGIAVHIAARVTATADAGEVIVSSTVKDLVAGSAIMFEDRGVHSLKGVPDEWHLFAVE